MILHHVHTHWMRCVLALLVLVCFSVSTYAAEQDEYSVFLGGFTAFQNQDYQGAATKMSRFLKQYPATPLRDMGLFWLARAHYRLGEKQKGARYLAIFLKEYPGNPLWNAAERELVELAQSYDEKSNLLSTHTAEQPAPRENLVLFPTEFTKPSLQNAAAPESIVLARTPEEKDSSPLTANANNPAAEVQAQEVIKASLLAARADTYRVDGEILPIAVVAATPESSRTTSKVASLSMKDRAIHEYRSVQKKYPGTQAALDAADRLKALETSQTATARQAEHLTDTKDTETKATTVTLEVGQFAAADLSLRPYKEIREAGVTVSIPFEVVNRGNGADSFALNAGFPTEYRSRIASADHPESTLTSTPTLAPGERFSGMVALTVPAAIIDGQRSLYPLKMVSNFDRDISASKEIPLTFSAPLLRMIVRPEKDIVLPGETISYRMALLNVGSAAANKTSFSISYPPHYEPVEPLPTGFRHDGSSRIVVDKIKVGSGGREEFNLAFRLKQDAIAGQELFCRVEVTNRALNLTEEFLSAPAAVGRVSGVAVKVHNDRRTVLPGEKVVIPVSVCNKGNFRENLIIKTSIPAAIRYALYRDEASSVTQANNLISGSINALSPGEEASLRIELVAPAKVIDRTDLSFTITCETASDRSKSATAAVQLVYARPVVALAMEAKKGRLKPGEIAHLVLSAVNNGSSMAKNVEVISHLPERIEVVAAEPAAFENRQGERLWQFSELGPGEKRSIVLTYRVKPGVTAGTNLQIENRFRYKDQLGNFY